MRIEVKQMSKTYQSGIESVNVLKDITFTIESGSWMTITGPSGSGKTTFLRCLSTIEKADKGIVKIGDLNGMNATEEERSHFRRTSLGYIFQDFQLFEQFDVLTNVMIPLLPYMPKQEIAEKAKQMLESVGLLERKNFMPNQLSGGEKQRTAIARALMNDPELLLCDEPTGNLDLENRDKMIAILQQINKSGVTVVLVTHDPELAGNGDIHGLMRDGELTEKSLEVL
ncbi:ABC transporter ATP-binding protein [Oceanobacillus picturae]|uniref:ABC transporter ATP-binding protein n=1 Tax=Oceanobacillus picturae TaxID=171693 RepID=UPI000E68C6BE|nr:ABC transporter ATP-binding protein [Oceanobacillus picturae]RIU92610.1 ABC transporter ATP-binding protein [Oceanobacillus picturae]